MALRLDKDKQLRKYNEKSWDKVDNSLKKKYLEVTVGHELNVG